MTETELQSISREAAGCLPERMFDGRFGSDAIREAEPGKVPYAVTEHPAYEVHYCWLHESTEACTEIMVRVLLPCSSLPALSIGELCIQQDRNGIGVVYIRCGDSRAEGQASYCPAGYFSKSRHCPDAFEGDPMLAFRVAVLKALIALKKGTL